VGGWVGGGLVSRAVRMRACLCFCVRGGRVGEVVGRCSKQIARAEEQGGASFLPCQARCRPPQRLCCPPPPPLKPALNSCSLHPPARPPSPATFIRPPTPHHTSYPPPTLPQACGNVRLPSPAARYSPQAGQLVLGDGAFHLHVAQVNAVVHL
jgi:hypothetical protein